MASVKIEFQPPQELHFERRSDLKDHANQDILLTAKTSRIAVKCQCNARQPLLTISFIPNSTINTLKRNPHHNNHSPECIFYAYTDEFYDFDNDKFTKKIFLEVQATERNGAPISNHLDKEEAARYTYRHFCIDVLSEAISYAFNAANHAESANMQLYTKYDYFSKLSSVIGHKILTNGQGPYESLPKYHYLSFGTISQDLNQVVNNSLTLNRYVKQDNSFQEKQVRISDDRLRITKNLVNNLGNILPGPYAYIAVYKSFYENKVLVSEIVRLYVYAVHISGDNFCFVESGLERNYANQLFEAGTVFIKPVNGYEYKTLANRFYPNGRPNLIYRPDFIEFNNAHVTVTEVCGYPNDQNYMDELARKEQHYNTLQHNDQIIYQRV